MSNKPPVVDHDRPDAVPLDDVTLDDVTLDDVTLENEFALLADAATDAGLDRHALPPVGRRWVNPTVGGHLSAVVWGQGSPEVVFLHDAGRGARQWDAAIIALGRSAAALDLPGHGRSNWRRDGRYEPARLAPAVAEAIASFAPRARLVVGSGLGALTALAVAARRPDLAGQLVLLDTLPGAGRAGRPVVGGVPASRADAVRLLAGTLPPAGLPRGALLREVLYGTAREPDGSWAWRHDPALCAASAGPAPALAADQAPLWDQLAAVPAAVSVVHGGRSLSADDLGLLARRAPGVRVVATDGTDSDVETARPMALARILDHVLDAARARRGDEH
ncbi:alpha/beta fold hydrolase [Frankia sp. QA3]|uniref:alpha/beta fold hydrolase n=1 Tax=Frankia sp. QA3 TaxID=710111 RepID=UPI000269CEA4|nr:alpha/beta hydrolase [Frankia sp. QA3]EIV96227.1 hypothetical protein FraQA3DRAFT_6097 [Frankia sp. QA3]